MTYDWDGTLHALMAVLESSTGPIGTRAARAALNEMGISMSESSVSRRLRELDSRGWTTPVGTKGRILSPEGRQHLVEFEQRAPTVPRPAHAVDVRDVHDMLDLLYARKAVESALAANVAVHATDEDIENLQKLIADHRGDLGTARMANQPGLNLHRKIAAIAPNRMLKTLAALVLAPHLDRVEAVLDIALGSETHQHSVVDEHQQIVDAIVSRDPARAARAVNEHFDSMIEAGEKIILGDGAPIMERLLTWMDSRGKPLATPQLMMEEL